MNIEKFKRKFFISVSLFQPDDSYKIDYLKSKN